MLTSWFASLKYLARHPEWKLIGRSHAHIGSINTRTSRNDLTDTIDNGHKKVTS